MVAVVLVEQAVMGLVTKAGLAALAALAERAAEQTLLLVCQNQHILRFALALKG
jgi:hypothetical protein